MQNLMISILNKMLISLLTETFVSKLLVHCLTQIAKSTTNELDNKIVKSVADALGVEQ